MVKFVWRIWTRTYPFFNPAKMKNLKIVFVGNFFFSKGMPLHILKPALFKVSTFLEEV